MPGSGGARDPIKVGFQPIITVYRPIGWRPIIAISSARELPKERAFRQQACESPQLWRIEQASARRWCPELKAVGPDFILNWLGLFAVWPPRQLGPARSHT